MYIVPIFGGNLFCVADELVVVLVRDIIDLLEQEWGYWFAIYHQGVYAPNRLTLSTNVSP